MIPVIYVHGGGRPFEWISDVIRQAKKFNEEVIWIGDQPESTRNIKDYSESVDKLAGVYVNLSSNAAWFEQTAFNRWLVLRDYMKANNIKRSFHLDSDVLLYTNVSDEDRERYRDYPLTLVVGNCGAATFIDFDWLDGFADFILQVYTERGEDFHWLEWLRSELIRQGLDGGACDMVFLKWYRERHQTLFAEMTEIVDGTTWDHTMLQSNPGAFQMRNGVKDIHFHNGLPHGTQLQGGEIRFKSLHFQGLSDSLIPEYAK